MQEKMQEKIKALAEKYYPLIRQIRREIHARPELAFEEEATAALVAKTLADAGIKFKSGIAKTGILACIRGEKNLAQKNSKTQNNFEENISKKFIQDKNIFEKKLLENSPDLQNNFEDIFEKNFFKNPPCVLLRADMDALPVEEATGLEFASKIPGKMHACAHDGHTAGLLGAALILNELRGDLGGWVKFMFQPAEETTGGAGPMMEEGILGPGFFGEDPAPQGVFGVHLWGPLGEGRASIPAGAMMAGVGSFELEFIGRAGHGAHPHTAVDALLMAARFVNDAQSLISRGLDPLEAGVLTIGKIEAGSAPNIIAGHARLAGTLRFLNSATEEFLRTGLERVAGAVAAGFGGDYRLAYASEYPPLINDAAMAALARRAWARVLGEDGVIAGARPDMGAEDFAFLARALPGAFIFLGLAKEGSKPPRHHSPDFSWDEENLKLLMRGHAQMAVDFLAAKLGESGAGGEFFKK